MLSMCTDYLIHTSILTRKDSNSRNFMQLLKRCKKSLLAHYPPYKALLIRYFFPIFPTPKLDLKTI